LGNASTSKAATVTDTLSVSVIIPVFNDADRLRLCLQCLSEQSYTGPTSIFVVDNGSTDHIASVKRDFPAMTWMLEPAPGSYNARNRGLSAANSEIVAFTDSDCQPHRDWLKEAVAALSAHPTASFIGGRIDLILRNSDNKLSIAEVYDLAAGFPQQRRFVERAHFAMTANMVTRRAVIDRVGRFNGAMKSGGDREWGNRAWECAGPGVYVDDMIVLHPVRADTEEILKRARRVAGGERDRHPGWAACLRYAVRSGLLPPRQAIRDIWSLPSSRASANDKLVASGFALRVRWTSMLERLKLQLTGGASQRS